ncbi:hypothetical protein CYMTET_29565 [Cymbomonas tetramitiformis]|nr:hypothetical protein CYMTET_29565 [Cymbomonas tetramitiformis]
MMTLWFSASLSYYGLSLGSGHLQGNLYYNAMGSALMEIPACIVAAGMLDSPSTGRRLSVAIFYLCGAVSCLMLVLFRATFLANWAHMLGKLAMSAAFDAILVYSIEVFPTAVRGSAMGLCSAMARVAAMLAPVVLELCGMTIMHLLFGCMAACAAMACFLGLPETSGQSLKSQNETASAKLQESRSA